MQFVAVLSAVMRAAPLFMLIPDCFYIAAPLFTLIPDCFYSSSRNTRDFSREIRAQSEIWLHREYNLAMKNKSLRRIADMRSGRRLRAAHVAARTPRRS